MKKIVLSSLLLNLLAACSINAQYNRNSEAHSGPIMEEPPAPVVVKVVPPPPPPPPKVVEPPPPPPPPPPVVVDPLDDPGSVLSKRSVYFPTAVDEIQAADEPVISAHGAYLASHPNRHVTVEGIADQRGKAAANQALGLRRAVNTKKALVLAGAKEEQVDAISLGSANTVPNLKDAGALATSRRVDFIYK